MQKKHSPEYRAKELRISAPLGIILQMCSNSSPMKNIPKGPRKVEHWLLSHQRRKSKILSWVLLIKNKLIILRQWLHGLKDCWAATGICATREVLFKRAPYTLLLQGAYRAPRQTADIEMDFGFPSWVYSPTASPNDLDQTTRKYAAFSCISFYRSHKLTQESSGFLIYSSNSQVCQAQTTSCYSNIKG